MGRKSFEKPRAIAVDGIIEISCLLSSNHKAEEISTIKRKIYRRTLNEFAYGVDYMEYFSGINPPSEDEMIFKGLVNTLSSLDCVKA